MEQKNIQIEMESRREISFDEAYQAEELFVIKNDGHKFEIGEELILTDLQDFPEYNGESVKVTNFREDGPYGQAYYIEGRINKHLNWVYGYRLKRKID